MRSSKFGQAITVLCLAAMIFSSLPFFALAAFENTHNNTGDGRTDLTAIANTQIGYAESSDRSTKYGTFIGDPTADWSAAFISWCADQADIPTGVIPAAATLDGFRVFFEENSCSYRSLAYGGGYTPFKGDLVFLSNYGSQITLTGIGIVTGCDEEKVYFIEGNRNDRVVSSEYSLYDDRIVGYACPKYLTPAPDGAGYYKTNSSLNLLSAPSSDSAVLAVLPVGARVYVSGVSGSWGSTVFAGKTGWLNLDYCTYQDPLDSTSGKSLYLVADISKWNDSRYFKWDQFQASGVEGVIIRIGGRGYGSAKSVYSDTAFLSHYNSAKNAGLHVGVYFFSYALSKAEALEEANFTLNILRSNNIELDMPVFIDIEDYAEGSVVDLQHYRAGKSVCTAVVNTFCGAIEKAGYYPGIYCNKSFAQTLLDPSAFTGRATWIAQYGVSKCTYSGDIDMWQYTKSGRLPAFSGSIDLSYCYTDFPSIISPVIAVPDNFGEHVLSEDWEITSSPTCYAEGERVKVCADCGKVLISEKIPSAHVQSKDNVLLLNTGVKVNDTLTQAQLLSLHPSDASDYGTFYGSYELVGGTLLSYCTLCKKVLKAEYSYPGETHSFSNTQTNAATCASEGKTAVSCSDCGKVSSEALIPKTEHSDGRKTLSRESCTVDGSRTAVCSECGLSFKTEFVPASAHVYSIVRVLSTASLFTSGRQTFTCSVCGDSFTEDVYSPDYGDADLDGTVSASDARIALRAAVSLEKLPAVSVTAADADNSGDINGADARIILRIAVGLDDPDEIMDKYY